MMVARRGGGEAYLASSGGGGVILLCAAIGGGGEEKEEEEEEEELPFFSGSFSAFSPALHAIVEVAYRNFRCCYCIMKKKVWISLTASNILLSTCGKTFSFF